MFHNANACLKHVLKLAETQSKLRTSMYSSSISFGFLSHADDHIEGKPDLSEHLIRQPAATFFARSSDQSMRYAGIFVGYLLNLTEAELFNDQYFLARRAGLFPIVSLFKEGINAFAGSY